MSDRFREVIHWRRSWGDDGSACGRLGAFSEAVICQDLVTCKNCRRIFRGEQDRKLAAKLGFIETAKAYRGPLKQQTLRKG